LVIRGVLSDASRSLFSPRRSFSVAGVPKKSLMFAVAKRSQSARTRIRQGRTVLMVYGRSAAANLRLIEAVAPLDAQCGRGHTGLWHQLSPGGLGFVPPDYAGAEALITAGLPPPTQAEAAALKEAGAKTVTSCTEQHGWVGCCDWLDRVAQGASPILGSSGCGDG